MVAGWGDTLERLFVDSPTPDEVVPAHTVFRLFELPPHLFAYYLTAVRHLLDHDSPVPLYHQLVEAIRYRIATGELATGDRLPSLRAAAAAWRVNLHTVRRAYLALAEVGIIAVRPKSGARVLPPHSLAAFADAMLKEARVRWGVSAGELAEELRRRDRVTRAGPVDVAVVECSDTQALDLARQLQSRWRVRAHPWSLERDGEPAAGPIVATFFHYNEVRVRWPRRLGDIRFAAIHPDPALRDRLLARRDARSPDPVEVVLCERDAPMARNIAADLVAMLPPSDFAVRWTVEPPGRLPETNGACLVVSPRVRGEFAEVGLGRDVCEVRYVFDERDLEALGGAFGWETAA